MTVKHLAKKTLYLLSIFTLTLALTACSQAPKSNDMSIQKAELSDKEQSIL